MPWPRQIPHIFEQNDFWLPLLDDSKDVPIQRPSRFIHATLRSRLTERLAGKSGSEHVVVRQVDGLSPQPAQRFAPDAFVAWVAKQVQQADVVHCCYEAGPFGFVLHRRLVGLGVKNLVVRPRNWDEYGKKVKTDRRDALALVSCLDRYVAGNTEALTSIRVPTETEEQSRSVSRQREQLLEHRKRLAAQGLSCARYYGHDLPDEWWRAKKFETLRAELPEFLFTLLEGVQRIALVVHTQLDALSEQIESAQTELLPTGLGALTSQVLDRETGDWHRFKNRRQIASYTGMVPSEHSSGERRQRGAITKHGNPRMRCDRRREQRLFLAVEKSPEIK